MHSPARTGSDDRVRPEGGASRRQGSIDACQGFRARSSSMSASRWTKRSSPRPTTPRACITVESGSAPVPGRPRTVAASARRRDESPARARRLPLRRVKLTERSEVIARAKRSPSRAPRPGHEPGRLHCGKFGATESFRDPQAAGGLRAGRPSAGNGGGGTAQGGARHRRALRRMGRSRALRTAAGSGARRRSSGRPAR